jgi:hypothetical protein
MNGGINESNNQWRNVKASMAKAIMKMHRRRKRENENVVSM